METTDEYVQRQLLALRNKQRNRFVSTIAGRLHIRIPTERRVVGPDGKSFRIVQHELGGTQVETEDHLHAVVRPPTIRLGVEIRGGR